MSEGELETLLASPVDLQLTCSTVAVQRGVKTATAAALNSADTVFQDEFSLKTKLALGKIQNN